jgi:hypothetical protein
VRSRVSPPSAISPAAFVDPPGVVHPQPLLWLVNGESAFGTPPSPPPLEDEVLPE